jgi:hypothetical protein
MWVKDRVRRFRSLQMKNDSPLDAAKEAGDLLALAAWYRSGAQVERSDNERGWRLEMAVVLEKRAHTLTKPD